jgi:hypothetical protein
VVKLPASRQAFLASSRCRASFPSGGGGDLGQFKIQQDNGEQIIEIMGEAGGQNPRGLQFVQNEPVCFGPLACGDVRHRHPAVLSRRKCNGLHLHFERRAAFYRERHVAALPNLALKYLLEKSAESRPAGCGDEMSEASVDQCGSSDPQQTGPRQVRLANDPFAVKGQVTHRREIVKVGVFLQQRLRRFPGFAEFLVLHLQFDLVDLQFVKLPLVAGVSLVRGPLRRMVLQPQLGATAQFGGIVRDVRLVVLGGILHII